MKKYLALALLSSFGAQSNAGLYGAELDHFTPMITKSGHDNGVLTTGVAFITYGGGVTDAGPIVSQILNAQSDLVYYPDGRDSTGSISIEVGIHALWLETGPSDTPPSSLYLNVWESGTTFWSGTASELQSGFARAGGTLTAPQANFSAVQDYGNPYNSTDAWANPYTPSVAKSGGNSGFRKPSLLYNNLTWFVVGFVNGQRLWRTVDPIIYTTPSVGSMVYANATGGYGYVPGPSFRAKSTTMASSAGGFGYHLGVAPWP